jgi:hypothetical protein
VARINRVLDAAAWPATYRDLHPTGRQVIAGELAGSVADLLGRAADSSGGAVFGDLAGRIAYRPIDWQTYTPGTPPDAVVGNVDPGDVCPQTWQLSFRRRDVAGRVAMGRDDGTAAYASAPVGTLAAIGPEPFERGDLETYATGDLQRLADRMVETRGLDTMPRVESVTFDAGNDPGDGRTVELMATARTETPTRLRCRLATGGRTVFDRDMFVTGAAHTINERGRWGCRLTLDVAAPYAAVGGRWDGAYWDQALWADPLTRALGDLLDALGGARV